MASHAPLGQRPLPPHAYLLANPVCNSYPCELRPPCLRLTCIMQQPLIHIAHSLQVSSELDRMHDWSPVTGPLSNTLSLGSESGVVCVGWPGIVLAGDPRVGVKAFPADVQVLAVKEPASPLIKALADFLPAPSPRPCAQCASDFCRRLVAGRIRVGWEIYAAVGLAQAVVAARNGPCPSCECFIVQPGIKR